MVMGIRSWLGWAAVNVPNVIFAEVATAKQKGRTNGDGN
jgi:hypothetical protein